MNIRRTRLALLRAPLTLIVWLALILLPRVQTVALAADEPSDFDAPNFDALRFDAPIHERGGREAPAEDGRNPRAKNERRTSAADTPQRVGSDPALVDCSPVLREDAQLCQICFVDENNGWAVGDHGVIWHTSDGGHRWQLQTSGVDCRLQSVCFLNARLGWAVGGYTQPYTHASTGVMLRTEDGGAHWAADRKLLLPRLERIKFFDSARGWAIAEPSALFPSNVFTTTDGGRSWSALAATSSESWLSGDFSSVGHGALAGRNGALATASRRNIQAARNGERRLQSWQKVRLDALRHGWVVGDGGTLLETRDGGSSWQTAAGGVPRCVSANFDLYAVDACQQHCWAAGAPGTRVLHSGDGGQTWDLWPTGNHVPIRDLCFIDPLRGWAAADLGTILATVDGGRTWTRQRSGGQRVAWIGFYARPREVPFELVASLAGDRGCLGAVEVACRTDLELPEESDDAARGVHDATVVAGGSATHCAWQFPVRQAELDLPREQVIEAWNGLYDGRGIEALEAHLVRELRTWRPSIVLLSSGRNEGDAAAQLIAQMAMRAVDKAADPAQFADQISEAGLAPWAVQKIYAAMPPGQAGSASIVPAQIAPRLGRSPADLAEAAYAKVSNEPVTLPKLLGFRLLVDRSAQDAGKRDFLSGVSWETVGQARRMNKVATGDNMDRLRRAAQMRRNMQAILTQADANDARGARQLASASQLSRTIDAESSADLLFQLGDRYRRAGKFGQAAESYAALFRDHRNHRLCGAALLWLIQYYASGELGITQEEDAAGQEPPSQMTVDPEALAALVSEQQRTGRPGFDGNVRQASAKVQTSGPQRRAALALQYARALEKLDPRLSAEPRVQLSLVAAHRQQANAGNADALLHSLAGSRPHDAWWACAEAEHWLEDKKRTPPKPIWNCGKTESRPTLDGKLDDAMWAQCTPVELHSPQQDDADWPAVAMLAHDEEFLYLAVSCHKAPGVVYRSSTAPRKRDADLAREDRIELCIDTDRDWQTYSRLTLDHRGWTSETCWGCSSWNPQWYVAAHADDDQWTAEAAIPLRHLARKSTARWTVWAVNVQRVVPGVGFQSWSQPASAAGMPQGFGLLILQ